MAGLPVNRRAFVSLAVTGSLTAFAGRGVTPEEPLPEAPEVRTSALFEPDSLPDVAPEWTWHSATFYCPCDSCCGVWRDGELVTPAAGITATGKPPVRGRTVAVDPRVHRLGSRLEVVGLPGGPQVLVAEDTGAAIVGRRLDVFVEDHEEALRHGRRKVLVRKA